MNKVDEILEIVKGNEVKKENMDNSRQTYRVARENNR